MAESVPQEWTNEVVSDHVASIVFDGEEFEPECVLCQKAVGLGYFAHYGYEVDPAALIDGSKRPPPLSPEERKKRADGRDRGELNDGSDG